MVLVFGPPGSGKSVQGGLLVNRNGWHWLSTGQLFRKSSNPAIIQRMASGNLINDNLTDKILTEALQSLGDESQIVLDGYPRNIHQAKWLARHLPEYGREVRCVIIIEVPKTELLKRLSGRGRAEDTPAVIERRIDMYNERIKPIIDFYRQHNMPIYNINGVGSIKAVNNRIQTALAECSLV